MANFSKAFDVELKRYEHPGGSYRGRTGPVHVPAEIADIVQGVFGLDDRPQAKAHFQVRQRATGIRALTPDHSFTPTQLATLYDFPKDADGSGQTITTSPGHPFYSVTRQGWVGAGELHVGEQLRNFRGGTTEVQAVSQPRYGPIEMYNLEVEDFHTFYVGKRETDAVLVHNGIAGLCSIVKPLGQEEAAQLSESVRFRMVKGDAKGRPFGTPGNPRAPTVGEFNPRIGELEAWPLARSLEELPRDTELSKD